MHRHNQICLSVDRDECHVLTRRHGVAQDNHPKSRHEDMDIYLIFMEYIYVLARANFGGLLHMFLGCCI